MNVRIDDFSIEAIAESGQCFRITRSSEMTYTVVALGRVLEIREEADGSHTFSCGEDEYEGIWKDYFDLGTDYSVYRQIVLPEDEYLKQAINFGRGIRVLRQDPWEMLISFIISQRKSVPAIRTSVERLSRLYGKCIDGEHYAFPDAHTLANADFEGLRSCGLGYRTEYISEAAKETVSGGLDLGRLSELPTPELISELMELKGVGIKVASCVALFGYYRIDTVPVDVWMKRVIETKYHGRLPEEYAACAGVLQQYMFNYARLNNLR